MGRKSTDGRQEKQNFRLTQCGNCACVHTVVFFATENAVFFFICTIAVFFQATVIDALCLNILNNLLLTLAL